jgi:GTP pyrophosphokinase
MVTRSHLQLVQPGTPSLDAWRARLLASAGPQNAVLERALDFVEPIYERHSHGNGQPLLAHVLDVAQTLSELKLDADALAAAMLYPAFAESAARAQAVRDAFGPAVAELADGVVRMAQIGTLSSQGVHATKPQQQAAQLESLRKMLLAMVQDVRVVLIKLADHLQALRLFVRSDDAQARRSAAELTRDIFAPLANRLGVWHLKWELEDLAFRILEPATYKEIARLLDEKRMNRERYIEAVIALVKGELARAGIAAEVTGRPKHIFSIYTKMQRKGVGFDALHDVRAVRVLVDDVKDCYAALGLVHHLWTPIPKEFDDYIAKPKANHYRSLHTAVIGPEGKAVEVQIRTHEMHQHSELGIAAHWRYKEGARRDHGYDDKIAWLRQVLEWKDEVREGGGVGELAEQFRTGLFADTVYLLTPQGRVIDLPKGATPIDFAYHVHTELGHRCRGAKVDGAIVPLNTPLGNGQRVEILTAKQGGPSRDWLNPTLGYIRSNGARSKVRQWFNRQNFEADVAHGRAVLDKELQRHGATALNLDKLAEDLGFARLNDLLVEIARGGVGPKQLHDAIAPRAEPEEAPEPLARKSRSSGKGSVLIVGVDKLLTLTAKCCKPAPPDPIVGFVTRGRGISVHRADCSNVKRLDTERCVIAEWGEASGATFPVDVGVEALDRTGLLRDISDVLTRERINVTATSTQTTGHVARMRFTLEVENVDQLTRVLTLVRDVKGVLSAVRR